MVRTPAVSMKELASWSRLVSGTTTSVSVMSAFCTQRRAILCSIFLVSKPWVPFSSRSLDLVVGFVARPDHDHVGEGAVADPALGAVEDPGVPVPAGDGLEAPGDARAHVGLGQPEG